MGKDWQHTARACNLPFPKGLRLDTLSGHYIEAIMTTKQKRQLLSLLIAFLTALVGMIPQEQPGRIPRAVTAEGVP